MEDLPRVLHKREAQKTSKILLCFKETCAIEVKQTRSQTLPANSVKPHQRDYLLQAKHGIFRFKIPDTGRKQPFDAVVLAGIPAYVVVVYGDNTVVAIDIDSLPPINQKLTLAHAILIGKVII